MSSQTTTQSIQDQISSTAKWVTGSKEQEQLKQDKLVDDPLQQKFTNKNQESLYGYAQQKVTDLSEALQQFSISGSIQQGYEYLSGSQKSKELLADKQTKDLHIPKNSLKGKIKPIEKSTRVERLLSFLTARQVFTDEVANILTATDTKYFTLNLLGYTNMKVSQVVILGGGYDTRAHYLDAFKGLDVFELDLPEILDFKKETLKAAGAELTSEKKLEEGKEHDFPLKAASVTYVPIEFEKDSLSKKLTAHGYKKDEPTLWIAEDLFQFFDEKQTEQILKDTVRFTSAGSYLVVQQASADVKQLIKSFYSKIPGWSNSVEGGITGDVEKYYERFGWQVVDSVDVYQLCYLFSKLGYNQEILFRPNTMNYSILYKHITGADGSGLGTI